MGDVTGADEPRGVGADGSPPPPGTSSLNSSLALQPLLDAEEDQSATSPRRTAKSAILILGISKGPCHWSINFKH